MTSYREHVEALTSAIEADERSFVLATVADWLDPSHAEPRRLLTIDEMVAEALRLPNRASGQDSVDPCPATPEPSTKPAMVQPVAQPAPERPQR